MSCPDFPSWQGQSESTIKQVDFGHFGHKWFTGCVHRAWLRPHSKEHLKMGQPCRLITAYSVLMRIWKETALKMGHSYLSVSPILAHTFVSVTPQAGDTLQRSTEMCGDSLKNLQTGDTLKLWRRYTCYIPLQSHSWRASVTSTKILFLGFRAECQNWL